MNIIIVGAGDLGQLISYHIEHDARQTVVGFLDDTIKKGELVDNKPVLGNIKDAQDLFQNQVFDRAVIAIGYNHFDFRASVFDKIQKICTMYSFIHTSSYVDTSVKVGEGVVILPGCVFDKGCEIGDNVLFNAGVVMAHDSKVEKHSFFGPGVNVAGFSVIGAKCFVGINATILNNLHICDEAFLAAGSLVNKSITTRGTYIGIPAKLKL